MRINSYASTGQAIKAPFTFYYVRNNDWSESHCWDYWNKNFTTATSVNNTAVIKTIYDPSVSGFTLPKTAAFTNFTSSGNDTSNGSEFNVSGSFTKGWNFYVNGWQTGSTVFFHALGIRDTYNGRSSGVGAITFEAENGAWTSGAYSTSDANDLNYNIEYVQPQGHNFRSYGLTIHFAKED